MGMFWRLGYFSLYLILYCGDNTRATLLSSLPCTPYWLPNINLFFFILVTPRQEIFDFSPLHRKRWTWTEGCKIPGHIPGAGKRRGGWGVVRETHFTVSKGTCSPQVLSCKRPVRLPSPQVSLVRGSFLLLLECTKGGPGNECFSSANFIVGSPLIYYVTF